MINKKEGEKSIMENIKKIKKENRKNLINQIGNSIMGACKILALLSITYSSYVIITGTDTLIPKLLVVPQIGLIVAYLIDAFIIKRSK